MPIEVPTRPWWLEPLAEEAAQLGPGATGLSSAEAKARLSKFGPNMFRDHQEQPLWLQFLSRFKNPLVLLLLGASAISALTGEITNFLIISAMVLFSATLSSHVSLKFDITNSPELPRTEIWENSGYARKWPWRQGPELF